MTNEQKVKSKYPYAKAERYVSGQIKGMQTTYYLIWSEIRQSERKRLGEGDTKAKAWKDAAARQHM